ncbi:MAG TPA: hypothetical protein VKZ45_03585 [Vicingaceae bacterium]|nr:hypothetical protein [Vicingaceae bacterium]
MKRTILLFTIVALLFACASSSKKLEKGDYDAAMQISAKKIMKDPGKFEEVDVFNDAYRMANNKDKSEIDRLKQVGDRANWGKIYQLYNNLKRRQELAATLPPVGINYDNENYTSEIENAKNQAAMYAYEKGNELLQSGNRFEARKAHAFFIEANNYIPNYQDVNERINAAKILGTTNVYFEIADNSGIVAPKAMMDDIQSMNVDELDETWINYDNFVDTTKAYHYSIILSLDLIEVSPDELKETTTVEKKEVEDGFDYVLDANGNVTKDSLGNDIKIYKYKTISCTVNRYIQKKAARITANLNYFDNYTNNKIKTEPVVSDALFENQYTIAVGELDALSPETRKELNTKAVPFPPTEELLIQAGNVMKEMTKTAIVSNKSLIK